jgi:hypothetical protein
VGQGVAKVPETVVERPIPAPVPPDEFGLRLLRSRRGHGGLVLTVRVVPTAWLLIAVHLLLTGSRLSRSWWWQDDLNLLAGAAGRALTPSLLLSDYNGHLIPGTWALAWVFDRLAPLQWWPAALVTLAIVAATDLMLLALLRRLFGTRPALLFPFAMYCSTSLVLTSTLWWAAALQWLPVSLSLVTALWFHVGYLRSRRPVEAVGAVLAVLGGLLFFEKAATTPIVLALFTVFYAVPGPLWRRPWRAFRTYWQYWSAQGVLAGGFGWLYLSRVTIDTGPSTSTTDVVEVIRVMILETLLPSLIGGPLTWFSTPATTIGAWPHPGPVLIVIAAALTSAAVIGSLLLVRGAWRGWALLAVYLAISVALVARVRLGFIGPFIGRDHRYLTDLAVIAPLGLALAWLPLRGGLEAVHDGSARAFSVRGRSVRDLLGRRSGTVAVSGAVAVVLFTVGGVVSGETFMNSWSKNPTQAYIENLRADLAAHPGPVYLFGDEVVPDRVMTPTFLDRRQIGWVTRPMKVRPVVQPVVPSFSVVDAQGHLHDGIVRGVDAVLKKEVCVGEDGATTITLPRAVGDGLWKLRLGYYANRQTSARVSIGINPPVTMRLERGLHEVYISLRAGGSARIRVDGVDPGSSVCIGTATLGLPGPK